VAGGVVPGAGVDGDGVDGDGVGVGVGVEGVGVGDGVEGVDGIGVGVGVDGVGVGVGVDGVDGVDVGGVGVDGVAGADGVGVVSGFDGVFAGGVVGGRGVDGTGPTPARNPVTCRGPAPGSATPASTGSAGTRNGLPKAGLHAGWAEGSGCSTGGAGRAVSASTTNSPSSVCANGSELCGAVSSPGAADS
jgi:hypothetical protein